MSCRSCKTNNTVNNKPKNFFDFNFINNPIEEIAQTLATGATGTSPCAGPCLSGTGSQRYTGIAGCVEAFTQTVGVCTNLNGNKFTIWTPYDSLIINTDRLNNALITADSQFPTGSFTGYINSISNNFTNEVESSTTELLTSIFISILLQSYLLFAVICITLMAVNTITVGLGLFLLVFGLIVIGAALAIIYTQTIKFADRVQNAVNTNLSGVVDEVICAVGSGFCCYTGAKCCCTGSTGTVCTNAAFGPRELPPCGKRCGLPPQCPSAGVVSEVIEGID